MLNRLPKEPGSFAEIEVDIGTKPMDAPKLAKALGVSVRTIWRWRKAGAPRMARLALWWLTRNGQATWDAEAYNRVRMIEGWMAAQSRERGLRIEGFGAGVSPIGSRSARNEPVMLRLEPQRKPPPKTSHGERHATKTHVHKDPEQHENQEPERKRSNG